MNRLSLGDVGASLAVAEASDEPLEATQANALALANLWAGRTAESVVGSSSPRQLAEAESHTYAGLGARLFSAVLELEWGPGGPKLALEALEFATERDFDQVAQVGILLHARPHLEPGAERVEHARGVASSWRRSPSMVNLACR
ncbi:MAG: hypothetical protein R2716_12880 [Microthrixaceae bacterium]